MKLVYTDEVIKDLMRLRQFIATHSPQAAARIAAELISKIELLTGFPKMGMSVELAPERDSIRDIVFDKYVVRYSLHSSTIIVLRIWHGLEGER